MDTIYLRPLQQSHQANGLERAMMQIFMDEFAAQFDPLVAQIHGYGAPFLSVPVVVERFMKQDGLFVLRRPNSSDKLMRVIYANWRSLASKRGLGFLEFVLSMLWPNSWEIQRLYHPIAKANEYPVHLTPINKPDHFLTSRLGVVVDDSVDLQELSELSPTLQRLVPANIVPTVVVNIELDTPVIQVALACNPVLYCDFSS